MIPKQIQEEKEKIIPSPSPSRIGIIYFPLFIRGYGVE